MSDVAPPGLLAEAMTPGTSLLISGPPLTRKRELMVRLLADGEDDGASVMVSTKMAAGKMLALYREWTDGRSSAGPHVIDCVTRERGMGGVRETETTSYLSSARDMTGLSIELSGLFQTCHEGGTKVRLGCHSLSTFLMYANLQRVYRMVHVLAGQIESGGWFGAFVVDSPTDRERDMLSHLVDGVVETRETVEGTQLRLRGLGSQAGWRDY